MRVHVLGDVAAAMHAGFLWVTSPNLALAMLATMPSGRSNVAAVRRELFASLPGPGYPDLWPMLFVKFITRQIMLTRCHQFLYMWVIRLQSVHGSGEIRV